MKPDDKINLILYLVKFDNGKRKGIVNLLLLYNNLLRIVLTTEIFVEILLVYYSRATAKGVCWYSYLSSSYGQCRSKLMHYTPVSLSSPITDSVTQINNHLFSLYRQPVLRKAVNLRVSLKSFNPSGGGNFKHIFTWLMIVKAKLNYAYEMVKSHE